MPGKVDFGQTNPQIRLLNLGKRIGRVTGSQKPPSCVSRIIMTHSETLKSLDSYLRHAVLNEADNICQANIIKNHLRELAIPAPSQTLVAALEANLDHDQIIALFAMIQEKCESYAEDIMINLPVAFESAARRKSSPNETFDLFIRIVEGCGKNTVPEALAAALDTDLTPSSIIYLFNGINKKCNLVARRAFATLPAALDANLSPTNILKVFEKITEAYQPHPNNVRSAFSALQWVLYSVKAKLTSESMARLLVRLAEQYKSATHLAFESLPAALSADLSPEQITSLFGNIANKCWKDLHEAHDTLQAVLEVARPAYTPEEITDIFKQIDWFEDPEGRNSFELAIPLLEENCPANVIAPYINCQPHRGLSYFEQLNTSLLATIKVLRKERIGIFRDFSGQWLGLKGVVYLLSKISDGKSKAVQEALGLLLKYEIRPTYDSLRELVEFGESYPSVDNALRPNPKRKNNYSLELQEEVKLDFVYYQTNGQHKKAETLAWLLRKNRSEERVWGALVALRHIDERTIDLRKVTRVDDVEKLAEEAKEKYWQRLEASHSLARRILHDEGNRNYVQSILINLGFSTRLEQIDVFNFLILIEKVRYHVLYTNIMFRVDDVFNNAISELRCDQGDYQTEAPSFYEAWLAEMSMAVALHSSVISIQNETRKPLLLVLNERTAPTYFGRDHLPRSYAQRFGIVQDVDDEDILNTLGQESISSKELFELGQSIFSRGMIFPLSGFKIASSHDDIEDHTLGVYIRNITKMMRLIGGDVAFTDMSRRRVGGSTTYLYNYLVNNGLANVHPHGKLQEKQNNKFDEHRGRYGLMVYNNKKAITWHLLDPCRIDPEEFRETIRYAENDPEVAAIQYKELSEHLSEYLGGNKPFADDRQHAFYSMPSHYFDSPYIGIAPRFRKRSPAWLIPDLEKGIVPVHEFLAKITGRIVPEQMNGQLDKAVPYYRFPPYLTSRVDAILKELGINERNVRKRFYGSDCFGYLISGIENPGEKIKVRSKLLKAFKDQGLNLHAVIAGKFIDITFGMINKGSAVRHFSKVTRIPEIEIVRIGDQPRGNDARLLSRGRSYNVGEKDARKKNIKNTQAKGPDGVLEALKEIEEEGFDAIAFDVDGTIDSDPRVYRRIKNYLAQGKQVAIITGRGESIRRKFIKPMEEMGLSPKAKSNLHIYLYNGALSMKFI